MKKKITKKLSTKVKRSHGSSMIYIRYVSIGLVAIAIVLAVKGFAEATQQVHVLGVQTGPVLLADKGSDDSGGGSSSGGDSSGSGGGESNTGNTTGGGRTTSGSNISGTSSGEHGGGHNTNDGFSRGGASTSVKNNTKVDCIGPDGTHFTTSFKSCRDFNNGWHHSNFSFTPLSNPVSHAEPSRAPQQKLEQTTPETQITQPEVHLKTTDKFEVKTEDGTTKIEQREMKEKMEKEKNLLKVKTEKTDGEEVEAETNDTLDTLNKELETEGVEVASTDAHTLAIKKGKVEAETKLPISVDPTTHELTVTTPSGTKTVTILPDKAVENILNENILSSVESQVSQQDGTLSQKATLTEVNNELVFAVKGVLQKKLLGLIPVAFSKTGFVSATTGRIIKTDETLINRILEKISF